MKRCVAVLIMLMLGACDSQKSDQTLPDVNDANCTLEVINSIEARTAREEFAGKCSRRSERAQPTEEPKNWLELNK